MKADLEICGFEEWETFFGKKRPIAIAGPCSAETEEQVMKTALDLKSKGISIYRAGIWKPRTRPNAFEGVGEEGLKWLRRVKDELGLQVTTEVANAAHVELALKYGIDILWIGARTSVNPFATQEIADALKAHGASCPVLIKNPINPDAALWLGAVERINGAGIKMIGCIHRGFSSYGESKYRNDPQWQIPIELKRQFPDLPMICDPSHIAGNRELLESISQKAMDLNFDGLMIETHCDPENAWSDAQQQVTPNRLMEILNGIQLRRKVGDNEQVSDALSELRGLIDRLDTELLDKISSRMKISETIGHYKKQHEIIVLQAKRWDSMLQAYIQEGAKRGLSQEFITNIFKAVHEESINIQNRIMNEKDAEN